MLSFYTPDYVATENYFKVKDDACDWQGPEHREDMAAAEADVARRKEAVKKSYEDILAVITDPVCTGPRSRRWRSR